MKLIVLINLNNRRQDLRLFRHLSVPKELLSPSLIQAEVFCTKSKNKISFSGNQIKKKIYRYN